MWERPGSPPTSQMGSYVSDRPARNRLRSVRHHPLSLKLFDCALVLRQVRQPHSAQYVGRLGELDIVVGDNLYAIAPRVEEIQKWAGSTWTPAAARASRTAFLSSTTSPK